MDRAEIENFFTYHKPTGGQIPLYNKIRDAAKKMADTIVECTPPGADQTAAIRKLREAVMTANAAVACFPIRVEIEQVAHNITFKSYYLDNFLDRMDTTHPELLATDPGQLAKVFCENSARACGRGQRPDAFLHALLLAVHAKTGLGVFGTNPSAG
jgi:hypothetical protein